ncbi:hypothetical protein CI1B_49160 [Bradyrhizobium ivorense]|uniref:Resolvase/invertase-type recombinase catalytic domain-containing protein n=2 Tax=Bradyrhizobium ivorense TaxID=2511166 RepID=A0A508TFF5_9BRAD|nr:hypothetical protein CI1B_49160 [Bradyrhizobium ivorense]
MSSDVQKYSTENQQDAIAEYAKEHEYTVVATYIDVGKSGLSLRGRDALKQLLSDVLSVERTFDVVLVLDVSRWGRFQNPDQAAHYEFLCRQAGVRVIYCAEPFGDDIAPITTIIKHLKRVMAGEYSRELSAKLYRAHLQQALLGFRQGGKLIYGFRRLLVDPTRNPRQVLNSGEYKALSSDKVLVIPGPPEELAVIKRIFRLYVRDKLSISQIARRLASSGIVGYGAKPLQVATIKHLLRNELCIGQLTYNVTTKKMQGRTIRNPDQLWTRFPAFAPIVPVSQFRRAQERLTQSANRRWDKKTIAHSLRGLLAQEGRLSQKLIDEAKGRPSAETVANHFGSLPAAYAEIGYSPPVKAPFGMNGKHWSRKAILTGLQRLHASKGRITNRSIDSFPGLPSYAYIRRHFGSVADAMRQAGLPVLSHSQIQSYTWKCRKVARSDEYFFGVRWTDANLLQTLRRLYKRHGYISQHLLDWTEGIPSAYYFAKRFGSLDNARIMAHIPLLTRSEMMLAALKRKREGKTIERPSRQSRGRPALRYRSDDILLGLRRLATREGVVSARLIDADARLPSWGTVARHFGSLSAAYKLVGLVRLRRKPARFGLLPKRTTR